MYVVYINLLYFLSICLFTYNKNLLSQKDNINEAINRLKNKSSYGHDEISNKIIKSANNSLIQPLMLIINQMLMTDEFPSDLKISRVKPLFKFGDASLFSNYRPISLLPSFSKKFEHIIFKQLYTYMNDNKLFSIEQYGFRTGHSIQSLRALCI